MKTLIVLCSLATIAIAVPTVPRGNFDNFGTVIEDLPEKIREKKSPLHDASQEPTFNDGKETSQARHSHKTELTSFEKSKAGFRKPIIIKKKLGYQVYRDSDEEMAHAEPNEKCRKEFKVKLCDSESSSQSDSIKDKAEHPKEIISDKEMENSIKMARLAVEKLQRNLHIMEQNTGKLSHSKENLDYDMGLQQDIEMAKSALEHIQKNVELNDLKTDENQKQKSNDAEKIAEWKESLRNIYKNVEIPTNFEDAFKMEKRNDFKSENINLPKMRANEISDGHTKAEPKDEKINADNEMFVSPTDYEESKMKLHSESLTSDNFFNKNVNGHDTKTLSFNTDDHLMTPSSDVSAKDSNFEYEETVHGLMQRPEEKDASGNHNFEELQLVPAENNILNRDINSLISAAKNTENVESTSLQESHFESTITEKFAEEQYTHKPMLKTNEENNEPFTSLTSDQKRDSIKSEGEFTEAISETRDVSGTEQNNVEHHSHKYSDKDMRSSDVEMMLSKGAEFNDHHFQNGLHNNREAEHISKQFARMQINENHGTGQMLNGNYEMQDFPLMHSTHEREHKDQLLQASKSASHVQDTQLPSMNTEEHLNENKHNEPRQMNFAESKHLNENIPQHLKTYSELNNEHSLNPSSINNQFRNNYMSHEYMNARMHQMHNMDQQLRENHKLDDFMSMPSARKQHFDHTSQQFKSEAELHNDHHSPDFSKTNGLKNEQSGFNRHTNMRLSEGHNIGHELTDSQHFNDPSLLRWAQVEQHKDLQEFKVNSESNHGHKFPKMKHNGQHNQHKEPMHTRLAEDFNLGQSFTDSQELHDSHLMHWAQERQNNDHLTQSFDGAVGHHNEAHMGDHIHEHMPTNRFHDHFDLENSHDIFPMRSRMHEHLHMLKHAKPYEMDSSMQPSMHISMRDSDMPLGHHHHHHHGMTRTSYSPSLPIANSSPGAVGVFSDANTSCGIPLLLSCSPSVVSGSLAKAHSTGAAPTYRAGDDFRYYIKRDANNID